MTRALEALITAIHGSPRRGVLTVTGGGSGLLSGLLGVAGASSTVLEANVPYAARAMRDWLGMEPAQACSDETARALAMRAFSRAIELDGEFGFAVTASLSTTRPKRGAHRAHMAFQDAATTRTWTLSFDQSAGARQEQERTVTRVALEALGHALGVGAPPEAPATLAQDDGRFAELMLGTGTHVSTRRFEAALPGAFNPLHDGHRGMQRDAERRLGCPVGYEMSIANVDKPTLDYQELNRRLGQFHPDEVVVTRAPTFLAKARAMGGVVFIVGTDTMERIADARYYSGGQQRDAAIAELGALGCRFLVYGRVDGGVFKTLRDLALPPALDALCTGVPEDQFRSDLSSTQLRQTGDSRS